MDYEKAYKEALNRAKLLKYNPKKVLFESENIPVSDYIFPELKESEDERICREMITYLSTVEDKELIPYESWIAWIKKQGKSVEINPDEIIEESHQDNADHIIDIVTEQEKPSEWSEEDENGLEDALWAIKQARTIAKDENDMGTLWYAERWLKSLKERVRSKQGGQTSLQTNERAWLYLVSDVLTWKDGIGQYLDDPRVQELAKKLCSEYGQKLFTEPKFHEGDWVVFNNQPEKGSIYQVEKIKNFQYTLRHILGGSFPLSFSHENKIRPWTIADVVAGDILTDENDNPFIYCGHDSSYWKYLTAYCGISLGEFIVYDKPTLWTNDTVEPASKEQRDFLFQKMKEAGYEWDADKKKLKLN